MQSRESNTNLKKVNTPIELGEKREETLVPEINSWQLKVLVVKSPWQNCWLVDFTPDIHMCNNWSLMTEYCIHSTRIGGSTLDRILPDRGKIQLRLTLKDGSKGLILNLYNVFYLPNSPCNLLSLGLLNSSGIYHDNKNKALYKIHTRQVLV